VIEDRPIRFPLESGIGRFGVALEDRLDVGGGDELVAIG